MADIADIRRRRLEALGTNSAAAARSQRSAAVERAASNAREENQEKHEKHGKGGATTSLVEETQPVIPSEFECVLCLRYVCLCMSASYGGKRLISHTEYPLDGSSILLFPK